MQIKVYRGTHQIGGAITEIKTEQARILIDIGTELPDGKNPLDENFEIDGVTCGKANCDGVFVTHYHGDHVGMFEKVLPQIPIYMGETAKRIFEIIQRNLKNKLEKGRPELVAAFDTFTANKPIVIKDIKITPYCIDHSAFDAYMFLIEADGKRILHTGDFRMHGAKGRKMPDVFAKYVKDIDVLIIEGTMLTRTGEKVIGEHELGTRANDILHAHKNVFVLCSSANIDTIAEFYHAAKTNKKPFIVCDRMQADILQAVTENSKSNFYKFEKVYVYGKNLHTYMADCGFCFICRANFISQTAINEFPNSLLIFSMWSGYLDKKHTAFDEYKSNFVKSALDSGCKFMQLHTSGHATEEQLKQVCLLTDAKTIIPIHSEYPEKFTTFGLNADIRILRDGDTIELK